MSPALAGRFFTTELAGKPPQLILFYVYIYTYRHTEFNIICTVISIVCNSHIELCIATYNMYITLHAAYPSCTLKGKL